MDSQIWMRVIHGTVSSGYVIAMALICLLQYVLYLHRLAQSHQARASYCREKSEIEAALQIVTNERSLSRIENQLLREYITQAEPERGLERLLRHFVPDKSNGFSALLEIHSGRLGTRCDRGLSAGSRRDLVIDPEFVERVSAERSLVLEGSTLLESRLWASLSADDRRKVCQVFLFAVGDHQRPAYLLLTTHLYPAHVSQDQQIKLVERLMESMAGGLQHGRNLETHRVELRVTKEMLELRAVTAQDFETPLKMIEAFVARLAEFLSADRSVLFLKTPDDPDSHKAIIRCGMPLQAGIRQRWCEHEATLIAIPFSGSQPLRLDENRLRDMGIETLIGAALVVPLVHNHRLTGVICLTKHSRQPFGETDEELAAWAAPFLCETMHRALDLATFQRQARQDGLTELANRRAFDQQIVDEVQRAGQTSRVCSLILFDLDRFKSVNDLHGHQAGDAVLRVTARVIRDKVGQIRATDHALIARYGGEELAVLLPGFGASGALRIAETVRRAVEQTAIPVGSKTLHVTLSAGIATFPEHAQTANDLVAATDAALYHAKESGRNRISSALAAVV